MTRRFLEDEAGSTAIEYALIAALVSIGVIAALYIFRDGVVGMYAYITDNFLGNGDE